MIASFESHPKAGTHLESDTVQKDFGRPGSGVTPLP